MPKDKQNLSHATEHGFNTNSIPQEIHSKTKKQKSNPSVAQATLSTEKTNPQELSLHKTKSTTLKKDNDPPKTINSALKIGALSKSLYERIKSKLESNPSASHDTASNPIPAEQPPNSAQPDKRVITISEQIKSKLCKPHTSELLETKTEPLPTEQPVISVQEPKEKVLLTQENREQLHRHLNKMESDLYEMNKTVKPAEMLRSLHEQIRESHALHADEKEIETAADNSKAVKELRKRERTFSDDIEALDKIYKDDIISLESYEKNKKQIEKKIADIEDTILRTLEKEELDHLKERLEHEIKTSLDAGPFNIEHKRYREDLVALTRMSSLGMIPEKEYLQKKEQLNTKLNRADTIFSKIDVVFEQYKNELVKKIAENEFKIKRQIVFNPESPPSQDVDTGDELASAPSPDEEPHDIIGKTKQFLGISSRHSNQATYDPIVSEMRAIIRTHEQKDSLIKCAFILKGLIEKMIDIKEEQTYNELMLKLATSTIEPQTRADLIMFFEKVSKGEYEDSMKKEEIPQLLGEAQRLAKLIAIPGQDKEQKKEKNVEKEQIIKHISQKKSGLLDKIDRFFGV